MSKLKIACTGCRAGIYGFSLTQEMVKCALCGEVQQNPHWNTETKLGEY